jgi:hypothetical protein
VVSSFRAPDHVTLEPTAKPLSVDLEIMARLETQSGPVGGGGHAASCGLAIENPSPLDRRTGAQGWYGS